MYDLCMYVPVTREECIEKLKEIGQYGSGSICDMKMKLRKCCLDPKLHERLKIKSHINLCSLDPVEIPPVKLGTNV